MLFLEGRIAITTPMNKHVRSSLTRPFCMTGSSGIWAQLNGLTGFEHTRPLVEVQLVLAHESGNVPEGFG